MTSRHRASAAREPVAVAGRLWIKRGQWLLHAVLLGSAAWFVAQGHVRALALFAAIPLIFLPFSFGRLRMHDRLARHFSDAALSATAVVGLSLDAIMVVQALSARYGEPPPWLRGEWLSWFGPVWFSTHALWLHGYLLSRLASKPTRALARRLRPAASSPGLERRELFRRVGLAGVAAPLGISASSVPLSYDFRVVERQVMLPDWPIELDGLRVVHLSDIHVGGEMNLERLTRVAELANRCRPEIVLHTGDFLTHRVGAYDEPLYAALGQISAPAGQWACLGNHDYDDAPRFVARLAEVGVRVLADQAMRIELRGREVELAGFHYRFDRASRGAAYADIVSGWGVRNCPRLILNHDPTAFADLPDGCADLVLSGHTHGGHIGLQLGQSYAITVVGLAGYPDQGVFERGAMRLHVTRCVGFYGYPMRIGIPPEVALVILRSSALTV